MITKDMIKMSSSVPKGTGPEYTQEGYPLAEKIVDVSAICRSTGSVPNADTTSWTLAPGDSCRLHLQLLVVYGQMDMREDSPGRRGNLLINYDWAQKAYDGEDKIETIFDEGEDNNNNQIIDRYILPAPPPAPNMHVKVETGW